jgi:hypothetical protein
MLSIIGIKKTIKQHTADMDITDSVDYKNFERLVIPLTYKCKTGFMVN